MMKAKLIKIRGSYAVLLPKAVTARAGLGHVVEISVRGNQVILSSVETDPRGWVVAFRKVIAANGHDEPDVQWQSTPNRFDAEEWTW
jgi:hypothetical protein